MDQHKARRDERVSAAEPNPKSRDTALEALVRCLARIAAEKDYAAYGGAVPDAAAPEDKA